MAADKKKPRWESRGKQQHARQVAGKYLSLNYFRSHLTSSKNRILVPVPYKSITGVIAVLLL